MGAFDCQVFKVSVMSFGIFLIFPAFQRLLSCKRPVVERNVPEFRPQRYIHVVYTGCFCQLNVQGQSWVIPCISAF